VPASARQAAAIGTDYPTIFGIGADPGRREHPSPSFSQAPASLTVIGMLPR